MRLLEVCIDADKPIAEPRCPYPSESARPSAATSGRQAFVAPGRRPCYKPCSPLLLAARLGCPLLQSAASAATKGRRRCYQR
jgi:hypothetical protein